MNGSRANGGLPLPARRVIPPSAMWIGIVALSALVAVAGMGLTAPDRFVLPGLVALTGVAGFAVRKPAVAAAWLPVLLLPPQFLKVFAHEVALVVVAGGLLLSGVFGRRSWPWRLEPIEAAAAGLLLWAGFTVFWCRDLWWFTFNWRLMAVGFVALWTARRLGRWIDRETLLIGIAGSACGLSCLTLFVSGQVGAEQAVTFSRNMSTNVGWGAANYVAALLVLMLPTVLLVALHARLLKARVLGWGTLAVMALVVAAAASRGGAVLMAVVILITLFQERIGRRTIAVLAAAVVCGLALTLAPGGHRLVERFASPKELYSIVIRLLYFREASHRLQHLPWGLGLGQGYGYPDRLNIVDPHNYWLVLGPELGVPGLLLWITVLALLWRRSRQIARDPQYRSEGRALQLTLVISQLNCLFEPTFTGLHYMFLFYWIMGAYLGFVRTRSPAMSIMGSADPPRRE